MATSTKKELFWKGTRAAYNALETWNPHTYYLVKEPDGQWRTFYGIQKVSSPGGQLEPVKSVIASLAEMPTHIQGDRYLIGTDALGYHIIEIGPTASDTDEFTVNMRPLNNYSCRVLDRGGKEYQYVNGKLITYNDVDCGTYD